MLREANLEKYIRHIVIDEGAHQKMCDYLMLSHDLCPSILSGHEKGPI